VNKTFPIIQICKRHYVAQNIVGLTLFSSDKPHDIKQKVQRVIPRKPSFRVMFSETFTVIQIF